MKTSKDELCVNNVPTTESRPSTENSSLPSPDNNANINGSTSKGAIPKNLSLKVSSSKKSAKVNNNIVEPGLSYNHQLKERHHRNGYNECPTNQVLTSYQSDFENSYETENFWKQNKFENEESQLLTVDDLQTFNIPSACQYDKVKESFNDCDLYQKDYHLSDSSTEENELLSISDDGCVYTFKGDQVADLPSSFFSLDIPLQPSPDILTNNRQKNNPSPEMDYLEMDFDPGPSEDVESDTDLNGEEEHVVIDTKILENLKLQECKIESVLKNTKSEPKTSLPDTETINDTSHNRNHSTSSPHNETPVENPSQNVMIVQRPLSDQNNKLISQIRSIKLPWIYSQVRYKCESPVHINKVISSSASEFNLVTDETSVDSTSQMTSKSCTSSPNDINTFSKGRKVMIWTEEEASKKQISQIGVSACGATAVLNVLKALRFPLSSIDKSQTYVKTRFRENSAPLPEYLLSRSVAGCTHEEIINGLAFATSGEVYGRFFPMYPERDFDLGCFLRFWIENGAVPIATLNLQKVSKNGSIPDAWHHQMIFGISSKGIHLTNPLECVDVSQIWMQLCSESVLLVKKEDVLSRWNQKTDLPRLMNISHRKWRSLNVVGQVANLIRESRREFRPGFTNTLHIKIPASYISGVTIALRKSNPVYPLLRFCDELPLLSG